ELRDECKNLWGDLSAELDSYQVMLTG
ncbi:hypothetical protein KIPB_014141, partial [Kipferlia bialata]